MNMKTGKKEKKLKKIIGEDRDSNNKEEKRKDLDQDQKIKNIRRGQAVLKVIVVIRKKNIDTHRNLLEPK